MARVPEGQVALEVGFSTTLVGTQLTVEGRFLLTLIALMARKVSFVLIHPATNTTAEMSNISTRL